MHLWCGLIKYVIANGITSFNSRSLPRKPLRADAAAASGTTTDLGDEDLLKQLVLKCNSQEGVMNSADLRDAFKFKSIVRNRIKSLGVKLQLAIPQLIEAGLLEKADAPPTRKDKRVLWFKKVTWTCVAASATAKAEAERLRCNEDDFP